MSARTEKISLWRLGMIVYSACMLMGLAGLLWSVAWLVSSVEAMGNDLVRKAELTEAQMQSITSGTSIGSWLMQGHDRTVVFWIVIVSVLSVYGCAMLILKRPAPKNPKDEKRVV